MNQTKKISCGRKQRSIPTQVPTNSSSLLALPTGARRIAGLRASSTRKEASSEPSMKRGSLTR